MLTLTDLQSLATRSRPSNAYLAGLINASAPYYHFLYHLTAVETEPGAVLVLGVDKGVCCAHLCQGLQDRGWPGPLIGIDANDTPWARAVADHFPDIMRYVIGDTTGEAGRAAVASLTQPLGLLFFDSTHTYNQVWGEYEAYRPYLADQAILVFDDVRAAEGQVLAAAQAIPGAYLGLDYLHPSLGFGVKIWRR